MGLEKAIFRKDLVVPTFILLIDNPCRTHLFIGKPDTPENRKAFESVVPLGRGSTPDDVANACCYLASDEAAFITGVNLEVDGGRCV